MAKQSCASKKKCSTEIEAVDLDDSAMPESTAFHGGTSYSFMTGFSAGWHSAGISSSA